MATSTPAAPVASPTVPADLANHLVHGNFWDPFAILGVHGVDAWRRNPPGRSGRSCLRLETPGPSTFPKGSRAFGLAMTRIHNGRPVRGGGWPTEAGDRAELSPGRSRTTRGTQWEFVDPYQFGPVLTDFDLHLLGEGTHYKSYEKLGCPRPDPRRTESEGSTSPSGPPTRLAGERGRATSTTGMVASIRCGLARGGFWEIFMPDLGQGEVYKFEIKSRVNNYLVEKADPYGFAAEYRPKTASVVWDVTKFAWSDSDWMAQRAERQALDAPISIYELHLGSWQRKVEEDNRYLNYRELADALVNYLAETGFTHVELMPVNEHPFDGSWGYQPVGFFAPTSRHGSPDDFVYFVDTLHRHGYGVIIDWVPAHFPKDIHGLGLFDGTHLYEHEDPRLGEHMDWGHQDLQLRSGRGPQLPPRQRPVLARAVPHRRACGSTPSRRCSTSTIPGKRASGSPTSSAATRTSKRSSSSRSSTSFATASIPGIITAAEESTSFPGVSRPTYLGGLGFSLKWNMGWMNDTLKYFHEDPIHRRFSHGSSSASAWSTPSPRTSSCRCRTTRSSTARGRSWTRCPATPGRSSPTCASCTATCSPTPARSFCSWGTNLPRGGNGTTTSSIDWHLLWGSEHQGIKRLVTDLNADLQVRTLAPPGRLRLARLRVARTERLGEQRPVVPPPRQGSRRLHRRRLQLHPGRPPRLPRRRPRGGALPRDLQHRRRDLRRLERRQQRRDRRPPRHLGRPPVPPQPDDPAAGVLILKVGPRADRRRVRPAIRAPPSPRGRRAGRGRSRSAPPCGRPAARRTSPPPPGRPGTGAITRSVVVGVAASGQVAVMLTAVGIGRSGPVCALSRK